jgi:putative glycerol-1-phosphate prenyltransferase
MKDPARLFKKLNDGSKKFAVLVDPDKSTLAKIKKIATLSENCSVDFIFYGGSLLTEDNHEMFISVIKDHCSVPVILFPGNYLQINRKADGILLLSLISGRNPEMLIGKHVIAAPYLKASKLEVIPTGYMLIESGRATTVSYISNTTPIPADKDDIAVCTAMAGEMLGLKIIYMDAGSGALNPVSISMIREVRKNISLPLVIGGGIKTPGQAAAISRAGADLVVAGNAIENNALLIAQMSDAIHSTI